MSHAHTVLDQVSPVELRAAMGRFVSGITVITARDEAGQPVGATVSAFSSLSLDPPLVLVCLARTSQTLAAVRGHGAFAVNVLGEGHQSISSAFGRSRNDAAWDGVSFVDGHAGTPLLAGAHVAVDCRLEQLVGGGDHEILIGRVVSIRHPEDDGEPLVYYGGRYAALAGPPPAEVEEREVRGAAEREAVECALPTLDGDFRLLAHERADGTVTAALVHGDPASHPAPVVHAHVACLLGDALGSLACDCGARLRSAQRRILDAGAGVVLYTQRPGTDAFLCAGVGGPDLAAGAGLLSRLGLRRAVAADAADSSVAKLLLQL